MEKYRFFLKNDRIKVPNETFMLENGMLICIIQSKQSVRSTPSVSEGPLIKDNVSFISREEKAVSLWALRLSQKRLEALLLLLCLQINFYLLLGSGNGTFCK